MSLKYSYKLSNENIERFLEPAENFDYAHLLLKSLMQNMKYVP